MEILRYTAFSTTSAGGNPAGVVLDSTDLDEATMHARNPFPPGGVVEDPATGAAAAAFGGYLRELRLVPIPATITIHQGQDMGRPGVITVVIPADPGSGIAVTGTAVRL